MDRAEGKPVHHGGNACLVVILHDVCCLNQRGLPEGAYGASMPVGPEDVLAETLLVKSKLDLSKRVAPGIGRGDQASPRTSAAGNPTSSKTVRLPGSSPVTKTGCTTSYWPGTIPWK